MKNLRTLVASLAVCTACMLAACGGSLDESSSASDLTSARRHQNDCRSKRDCQKGQVCHHQTCQNPPGSDGGTAVDGGSADGGSFGCNDSDECQGGGLCDHGSCHASACNNRSSGKTGIRAQVRITRYQGIIHGRNGTHEIAFGTLGNVLWIHDPGTLDTHDVKLALNVVSSTDPTGLPHEIPFTVGETVEVEGEYIAASSAGSSGVAVIHFTHSTCGFVDVSGQQYR